MLVLIIKFLSNVNILINIEFDELWECDIETNNLKAILDPLTIKTNIISKDDVEEYERFIEREVNKVIISNSNLNIIKIIFFRHQHILIILIVIIILVIKDIFYIQSRYFI